MRDDPVRLIVRVFLVGLVVVAAEQVLRDLRG